jgi:Sulfotransferase family
VATSPRKPARTKGPIFIVGSQGSGTTLLRLMLDSHERIAIPHETGFMRAYDAMQFIPFKWTGRRWARRLGWSQGDLDDKLREFFEDVFMRYAAEHGKTRWGEKTPLHTWHVNAMQRLFPEAVFVATIRHPGATIVSNMRRFHRTVEEAAYHHVRYNKEIARVAARFPRRMITLRYEDLLLSTERVMRELLDWLSEPWSERVLEHHVIQGARSHERIEGFTRADDSRDPSRIARWAETATEEQRAALDRRAGRVGEFFGYSMDDPHALAPIGRSDSLLFGGFEIRRRMREFPDLDIATREPVPIYEQWLDPRKFELKRVPDGDAAEEEPSSLLRRVAARVRGET